MTAKTTAAAAAETPAERGVDDYPVGSAKQDRATKAVAVRADSSSGAPLPWAVMTVLNGGHWEKHENVADWPDLPGTPVPDAETPEG